MEHVDTSVQCPVCKKANIVAEVDSIPTVPLNQIPIGPASRSYFEVKVLSFHCSNTDCQIVFHRPPGKPRAVEEILQNLSRSSD